jgi:hypothetical protein
VSSSSSPSLVKSSSIARARASALLRSKVNEAGDHHGTRGRYAYLCFNLATHSEPMTLLARESSFSLSPPTSNVGSSYSSA